MKTINILLLGQSGVGKSTFINSLSNYVAFKGIEDVRFAEEVKLLVPTSFTMCNERNEEIPFKRGFENQENQDQNNHNLDQDQDHDHDQDLIILNERLNTRGESGTLGCKAYEFEFGDVTLNIIDTPGLVDTGGVEQDKVNIRNTLEFISGFEHLHGICILLKPNEPRLNAGFRYCIQEFLSQLHQSAVHNIIFAFTNSRCSTQPYRLGSTGLLVKQMISEIKEQKPNLEIGFQDNYFLFDSESFRYLVAKDRIRFDEDDKAMYAQSWRRSREEFKKMISYIRELPPYDVNASLCIHNARQLIEILLPHLKDSCGNIITNEEHIWEKKMEIQSFKGDKSQLKKILYIPRTKLVTEYFRKPRFICKSKRCMKYVEIDGEMKKVYPKGCFVSKNFLQTYFLSMNKLSFKAQGANFALGGALGTGALIVGIPTTWPVAVALGGVIMATSTTWHFLKCKTCGCRNGDHSLRRYGSTELEELIEDEETARNLEKCRNKIEAIQSFLLRLERETKALKMAKDVVDRAMGLFSVFLQHQAMAPYNDEFPGYLDLLIEEEKTRSGSGGGGNCGRRVQALEEQRGNYLRIKETIDRGAAGAFGGLGESIQLEKIDEMVEELKGLEQYGPEFRQALENTRQIRQMLGKNFRNKVHSSSESFASVFM